MNEKEKNIDQEWKQRAAAEKDTLKKDDDFQPPAPDFKFFVTTLSLQASIFLGIIPNPTNNQKEQNLPQAKFIIDTLGMLKEKTTGNLNEEESELLESVLYELRMQFLSLSGAPAATKEKNEK